MKSEATIDINTFPENVQYEINNFNISDMQAKLQPTHGCL